MPGIFAILQNANLLNCLEKKGKVYTKHVKSLEIKRNFRIYNRGFLFPSAIINLRSWEKILVPEINIYLFKGGEGEKKII